MSTPTTPAEALQFIRNFCNGSDFATDDDLAAALDQLQDLVHHGTARDPVAQEILEDATGHLIEATRRLQLLLHHMENRTENRT